ncbi:MAG: HDOD domain-containing protein [Pseudomonadales bacterium]|nr:HDOD domain-containing protein [Pseudomonadales bacterium]
MSNLATQIQQEVASAVDNDELELPSLPEVALRIREEAESRNVSAQSLAVVIGADPGLAVRMIRVANSPLFRATRTIEDLNMALSRLGVEYAANLATGFAMQQMFQATSDVIDRKMRSVWSRATEVAAVSGVLAKAYTRLRPDQATLAGLTHMIGVLPILAWAEEHPQFLQDSLTLDRVIDSIHGSLGTMILQRWEFPEEVAMVPAHYTNFERKAARVDYTDIVMVANLQLHSGTSHPYTKIDWHSIQAFTNIGLDPDVETGELAELSADIDEARSSIS